MSYRLVWAEPAIDAAAGYLRDDPLGLAALMDRIDTLTDDATPPESVTLGSLGLYRLQTGRYRVLYEAEEDGSVNVIHIGRIG